MRNTASTDEVSARALEVRTAVGVPNTALEASKSRGAELTQRADASSHSERSARGGRRCQSHLIQVSTANDSHDQNVTAACLRAVRNGRFLRPTLWAWSYISNPAAFPSKIKYCCGKHDRQNSMAKPSPTAIFPYRPLDTDAFVSPPKA